MITYYFDTNIFIYYFENHPIQSDKCNLWFNAGSKPNAFIHSSELLLSELLIAPFKTKDKNLEKVYLHLEQHVPNLILLPITKAILVESARIRATHGFRTPDAIHLATAVSVKADHFITADARLKSFPDIHITII